MNLMDEKTLVARAKTGDYEAFTALINAHKDKIYALARKLTGNKQDAEDIVQETLLKAVDNIDQFREEAAFGTWLYTIALNQSRAHYSRGKQADLQPLEDYLPAHEHGQTHSRLFDWADPHRIMEQDELNRLIDDAIAGLPQIYREAFVLRYIDDLPVKEVAALLNESEAAAKSRILRARLALRDTLSSKFQERLHG